MIPETSVEPGLKEGYIAVTSDGVERGRTLLCVVRVYVLPFHSVAHWREIHSLRKTARDENES